jgi:hypothetical protein
MRKKTMVDFTGCKCDGFECWKVAGDDGVGNVLLTIETGRRRGGH